MWRRGGGTKQRCCREDQTIKCQVMIGVLHSYAYVVRPPTSECEPYWVGLIDLDAGGRIFGRLVGGSEARWHCGMRVSEVGLALQRDDYDTRTTLNTFGPVGAL